MSFHGEKQSNATHQSVTDPDARMARKSSNTASILAYQASALVDNCRGLVVNTMVSSPSGRAEVEDAVCLLQGIAGVTARPTVGADKGYDTRDFVDGARAAGFTPHVAEKAKGSAVDGRTTRHAGYAISQRARKKIEDVFGWLKTVAGLRKVKHRGTARKPPNRGREASHPPRFRLESAIKLDDRTNSLEKRRLSQHPVRAGPSPRALSCRSRSRASVLALRGAPASTSRSTRSVW